MYAVSNRQISEAAGQGNNAAACYHFGSRTDLLRAIESKYREPIEGLRAQMLADIGDSTELRDWVDKITSRVPVALSEQAIRSAVIASVNTSRPFKSGNLFNGCDVSWDVWSPCRWATVHRQDDTGIPGARMLRKPS